MSREPRPGTVSDPIAHDPLAPSSRGNRIGFIVVCVLGSFFLHSIGISTLQLMPNVKRKRRALKDEDIEEKRKKRAKPRYKVKVIPPMPSPMPPPMVVKKVAVRKIVRRYRPMAPPPTAPTMEPARPEPLDFTMSAGVDDSLLSGMGAEGYRRGSTALGDPAAPAMRRRPAMRAPPPMRPAPQVVYVKRFPKVKSVPRARYPAAAKRAGIQGTVKLLVKVGKDGRVIWVKVVKGLGFGLDQAAVAALKRARFAPAMGTDGKPMVYTIRYYRYTFRLEE